MAGLELIMLSAGIVCMEVSEHISQTNDIDTDNIVTRNS